MSITLNDNIDIGVGKPMNAKYLDGITPYASLQDVLNKVPLSLRHYGQTFLVNDGVSVKEYWFYSNLSLLEIKSGGSAPIEIGTIHRTVWVSFNFGNDTTGAKYDPSKPYKTITAAKNAAISGDRIEVDSGNYTDVSLLKSGIEYYFNLGAKVTGESSVFQTSSGSCVVDGYGIFDMSETSTSTSTVIAGNSFQELYIKCVAIYNHAANAMCVDMTGSVKTLEIDCRHIKSWGKGCVRTNGGSDPNTTRAVIRNAVLEIDSSAASSGVQTFDVLDCYRAESALYDNIAIVNYSNSYGCVRCHATITVVAQHSFRGCTIVDRSDTGAYMIKSDDAQDRKTNWLFQDCEFYAKPSNSAMVTFNFHTNPAIDSMFFFKGTNLSNVPFGTPTAGVRLRNETNGFFYDPDFIVHWPIGDY